MIEIKPRISNRSVWSIIRWRFFAAAFFFLNVGLFAHATQSAFRNEHWRGVILFASIAAVYYFIGSAIISNIRKNIIDEKQLTIKQIASVMMHVTVVMFSSAIAAFTILGVVLNYVLIYWTQNISAATFWAAWYTLIAIIFISLGLNSTLKLRQSTKSSAET